MTNGVNLLTEAQQNQLLLDNHLLISIGHGHLVHHTTNGLMPKLHQIIRFGTAIKLCVTAWQYFSNRPATLSLELLTSIDVYGHLVHYAT